jgi:hypothetical protein
VSRTLKAFLRAIATICLWGGPVLALLALAGAAMTGKADLARIAVVGFAGLYVVVIAFLIGGVLRLLLSIDDRLERLEGHL